MVGFRVWGDFEGGGVESELEVGIEGLDLGLCAGFRCFRGSGLRGLWGALRGFRGFRGCRAYLEAMLLCWF